jgi:hypothetical protein
VAGGSEGGLDLEGDADAVVAFDDEVDLRRRADDGVVGTRSAEIRGLPGATPTF